MNRLLKTHGIFLIGLAMISLSACQCSPEVLAELGISITDSPIDNPLYTDAYVTISGIKVDGEEIDGFDQKVTVNVSALNNGLAQEMVDAKVPAGSYQDVELILDYDTDDQGEAPGCYMFTSYGRKVDLTNGQTGKVPVKVTKAFDCQSGKRTEMVVDFDLRQSIRDIRPGDEAEAVLVSPQELNQQALRMVDGDIAGEITGSLSLSSEISGSTSLAVIYVYEKGTFNKASEVSDGDGDGIFYEGAVSSTSVNFPTGSSEEDYTLAFLEPGEYELIILAYNTEDFSQQFLGYLVARGAEIPLTYATVQKAKNTKLSLQGDRWVQ